MTDQSTLLAMIEAYTGPAIREHVEGFEAYVHLVIGGEAGLTVNFEKNGLRHIMTVEPRIQSGVAGHTYTIRPDCAPVAA